MFRIYVTQQYCRFCSISLNVVDFMYRVLKCFFEYCIWWYSTYDCMWRAECWITKRKILMSIKTLKFLKRSVNFEWFLRKWRISRNNHWHFILGLGHNFRMDQHLFCLSTRWQDHFIWDPWNSALDTSLRLITKLLSPTEARI